MKKLLARLAALVLIIGAAAPAAAQLPLPGGSLIVTLTSPDAGSTVSGSVPVSAGVSIVGSLTVSRVDIFADGNFIGSDSTASYSVSWDTRTVGNGSHSLTAVAQDILGVRWTSNAVSVTVANDTTRPTVSINQAATQADPTSSSPVNFAVVFSESVSGFTGSDVTIGGTAGGTKTRTVSGGPSTYNVAVSGMTSSGTVIATIGAGVAQDAAGNTNTVSTSSDNIVTWVPPDTTAPSATISQAATQADPTSASPILFTVVFSEAVSGFTGSDVSIGGTAAGTKSVSVSGGPSTYTAAVSGMTSSGTVVATIAAGKAADAAGNGNTASTSTDNTVTFNLPGTTRPTVTINQAADQADPTSASPIKFTVVFSESVNGFTAADVTISGTAGGTKTVNLTCGSNTYCVEVSGMTTGGTVIATIAAGVATDAAGNSNTASTSTDNSVTWVSPDTTAPTVAITSPSNRATVSGVITVTADATDAGGVTVVQFLQDGAQLGTLDSTAPYELAWDTRTVADGSHTLQARAQDTAGNIGESAVVTVTVANGVLDTTPPAVTINQAAGQADPTSASPINFTVVFSEPVSGFTGTDVSIGGTAGGTKTVAVTGGPSTYNAAVSGMTSDGTVIASIGAGTAQDAAGNPNTEATSTDATVTFQTSAPPSITRSEESAATLFGSWSTFGPEFGTFSGGTIVASNGAGSTATFSFTGTAVSWIGSKCNVCGIASVSIDGGAPIPVDTAGAAAVGSLTSEAVFSASGLASGVSHSMVIRVTGDTTSGDAFIAVDAFDVTGGTGSNVIRFEENNAAVGFSADNWRAIGAEVATFSGGQAGVSASTGATATFTFTGTAVSWIGLKCNVCGIANVSIDGGPANPVDTTGPGEPNGGLTSEVVFSALGLAAGTHTLVITVTGTPSGGANIVVDAFDVTP